MSKKKMELWVDDEQLWVDVQKYRLDNRLKNNNTAVLQLIKKALQYKER